MELVGLKADAMAFRDGIYTLVDGYPSHNDFDDAHFRPSRDDMLDVADAEGVGAKSLFEPTLRSSCCFCFGSYLN